VPGRRVLVALQIDILMARYFGTAFTLRRGSVIASPEASMTTSGSSTVSRGQSTALFMDPSSSTVMTTTVVVGQTLGGTDEAGGTGEGEESPVDFTLLGLLLGSRRTGLRDRIIWVMEESWFKKIIDLVEPGLAAVVIAATFWRPSTVVSPARTDQLPRVVWRLLIQDYRVHILLFRSSFEFIFVVSPPSSPPPLAGVHCSDPECVQFGNYVLLFEAFLTMFRGLEGKLMAIYIVGGFIPCMFLDGEVLSILRAVAVAVPGTIFMVVW
jgi:hypothetical protein